MITAAHFKGKGKQRERVGFACFALEKPFASFSSRMHNAVMKEMTAALIIRDRRALLVHNMKHGLRIEPPGGKKEHEEGWEESVIREVKEELGVTVGVKATIGEYATHSPEGEFLVRLYLCEITSGEPTVMEPDKIPSFGWYSLEDMKKAAHDGTLVPNMSLALSDIEKFLK